MSPATFAQLVASASDEQLQSGIAVNGAGIMSSIFAAMPAQLLPEHSAGVDVLAEWRILRDHNGTTDRWQVMIRDGRCTVRRDGTLSPDVTYTLSAIDFLKLAAGTVDGPQLFAFGSLQIDGDIVLAARMPSLFNAPSADQTTSDPRRESPSREIRSSARPAGQSP
jgi:hypothetical protein